MGSPAITPLRIIDIRTAPRTLKRRRPVSTAYYRIRLGEPIGVAVLKQLVSLEWIEKAFVSNGNELNLTVDLVTMPELYRNTEWLLFRLWQVIQD